MFIPPPINNISMYSSHVEKDMKHIIGEKSSSIELFRLFGENRIINL